MMSAEDLGPDFHFERDPMALASILNEEGITPRSTMAKAPESRPFRTGLTPASKRQLNPAMIRKQTEYDFFEGKNGSVFYRPKPNEISAVGHRVRHLSGSGSKPARGAGFGRTLTTAFRPQRIGALNRPGPISPMRRRVINTEKKMNPMVVFPAPHRQSISERKAIPGLEDLGSRFKGVGGGKQTVAKKSLFAAGDGKNDSFEFAKPLSPSPRHELQSRAELILMREGLRGMPRESMSALLRQSLSKAELDKMFEDDSTENFEALEKRLKTPKRPKMKLFVSKIPVVEVTNEEKENVEPVEPEVKDRSSPVVHEKGKELVAETKSQPSAFLESLDKNLASTSLDDVNKSAEKTPAKVPMGNNLHKELLDESNVVNVEIEEEEFENEGEMAGSLPKSFSTADLPSAVEAASDEGSSEEQNSVNTEQPLMKPAISSIDLSDARAVRNVELASFYRKVLEENMQHQEEMKAIENEMKELMQKAKARREEFRSQWGVSPKSVNNLRTMKTMYTGVQSVTFSAEKAKPVKPGNAEEQPESTGEEVATSDDNASVTADETFDLEAEFNAVEDLIFNSAKKDIDPELTHAMTEAEILDFSGGGCQANLANAFDDILLDDEDMDITLQGVGVDESEVKQSGMKSALKKKKGVRFETADEDDEEIHFTLPKTPYSGAKKAARQTCDTPAAMRNISAMAEMELAMLYEDMDGKKGASSVKGKLDFE